MTHSFPTRRSSDLKIGHAVLRRGRASAEKDGGDEEADHFHREDSAVGGSGEMAVRAGLAHGERDQKGDRADRRDIPAEERFMPPLLQQQRDIFGGAAEDRRGDGMAEPDTQRAHSGRRSEEHTSELQSLMRISYAVFWLKKKNNTKK